MSGDALIELGFGILMTCFAITLLYGLGFFNDA
jgi:hypothetical protein